jgi:hypothetical protein
MNYTTNSRPRAARSIARATRSSKELAVARRAANKAAKVPPPSRDMQLPILQRIIEVLRERRDKLLVTMGKTGRGLLRMIISEQLKHFPWLTRHMVNHYIATHPDVQPIGTVVVTNNETVVSGLTDSSPYARAMYHPELQETKDRVKSINEIYAKQVRDGIEITDITLLNTDKGAMGICMEMFLDHKVQEHAIGKLSASGKKRRGDGKQDQ